MPQSGWAERGPRGIWCTSENPKVFTTQKFENPAPKDFRHFFTTNKLAKENGRWNFHLLMKPSFWLVIPMTFSSSDYLGKWRRGHGWHHPCPSMPGWEVSGTGKHIKVFNILTSIHRIWLVPHRIDPPKVNSLLNLNTSYCGNSKSACVTLKNTEVHRSTLMVWRDGTLWSLNQ